MSIINIFTKIITEVAKRNANNKEVKTADPVVFEEINKEIESYEREEAPNASSRSDMYKGMGERMRKAQQANESNPNVETADNSVFEEMLEEIRKLEQKVESQTQREIPPPQMSVPHATRSPYEEMLERIKALDNKVESQHQRQIPTPQTASPVGVAAWTNSQGGSLSIRQNPEMGSPKFEMRIPDSSQLTVLEYSNNTINLDGKTSRFARVEYNGQRGWILESYLNFN